MDTQGMIIYKNNDDDRMGDRNSRRHRHRITEMELSHHSPAVIKAQKTRQNNDD